MGSFHAIAHRRGTRQADAGIRYSLFGFVVGVANRMMERKEALVYMQVNAANLTLFRISSTLRCATCVRLPAVEGACAASASPFGG